MSHGMKSLQYQIQFLMSLDTEEAKPLREAQSYAMEKSGAALATAKNLTRALSPYIIREREGRHYYVRLKEEGVEHLKGLISELHTEELEDPLITEQGVVLQNRVARGDWSKVMSQVREFNLATAFVPRGAIVTVTHEGETYELEAL